MKRFTSLFFRRFYYLLLIVATFFSGSVYANDFYWVGGAGNWGDISHWATTSGGSIKQSIVPSLNDNVIFDANSGFTTSSKTVTVNISATCNNMTWNGSVVAPTFNVYNYMQINGSLMFQPGMSISGSGGYPIIFSSPIVNQTITTGNNIIGVPVTINGTGEWILQDSLKMNGNNTFSFTKGNFSFNSQYASLPVFSGSSTSGILNIANSTIVVGGSWNFSNTSAAPLTAANSVGSQITLPQGYLQTKPGDVYYNVTLDNTTNVANLSGGATFNKITFLNGGTLRAVITDSLILNAAKVYNIPDNNTVINKYLKARMAPCSGLIELTNTTATGTFKMGAGAVVDVANARIQNMTIQGPAAPYAASNSVDVGGNNGWAFTTPAPNTYYWVGGGGNWNDVSHWASSSGGTAGSGCVPTQYDNVVFDANSGFGTTTPTKTVTLDGSSYCNNMTWIGAPNNPALSVSNNLQISGSLQLQPAMTVAASGSAAISFTTTLPNQTITTAGVVVNSPVTFNGTGGWALQDSLKMPSYIMNFTNGNLSFNGQYVAIKNFTSNTSINPARTLNIANSIIDVSANIDASSDDWTYSGGAPLTAANSANSEIRIRGANASFIAKAFDVYYNVTFFSPTAPNNCNIIYGTYNKISVVGGNSLAMSSLTTDSLLLQSVGKYQFAPTFKINKYFQATAPPCSGLIELASKNVGTRTTITMGTNSVVNVSNAQIKDIGITGPNVPYPANNSIDNGNNSGWAFTPPASHTYYWVGGTGNWNNGNNWASTSGGAPGSGCVPTKFDNVIFDDNSGFTAANKTVTIDNAAYCDSMTWSGTNVVPILAGNQPLQINGSLKMQTGMNVTLSSTITFSSSRPNETIATGNAIFSNDNNINNFINLTFNGTGGWKLLDSIKMFSMSSLSGITFINGNLDLSGQYVKTYIFKTDGSNNPRKLNIANSTIDIIKSWDYSAAGSVPLTSAQTANSLIRVDSYSTVTARSGDVYNNVIFQSVGNTLNGGIYNRVDFLNGGTINNSPVIDTLLFTPGYSYTFQSGSTTTINKAWYASGNPCAPTIIQSSNTAINANVSMPLTAANQPGGIYLIDFVRMKNITAVTGADRAQLEAGNQSLANDPTVDPNYVNNINWIDVPYAGPSGIIGLGPRDSTIYCNALPLTLNTVNFAGSPTTKYTWYDNTTATTNTVTDTGSYRITVNYGSNCVIKDTISLHYIDNPTLAGSLTNNITTFDVTLSSGQLIGSPFYTLVSVTPADATSTPVSQASAEFSLPNTVKTATFSVLDQTTGCQTSLLMGTPLPVRLLSFAVTQQGADAQLHWQTASEQNSSHFEVEQSIDGRNFQTIGTVQAAGNSTSLKNYNYTDKNISRYNVNKIYYRLKQVDIDSRFEYTQVVSLNINSNAARDIVVYPVPFNNRLYISLPAGTNGVLQFNITDMRGRKVFSSQQIVNSIQNVAELSGLEGLAKDVYILTVETNQQLFTKKVIKK